MDLSKFSSQELTTEFIAGDAEGDVRYAVPRAASLVFVFSYEPGEVGQTHVHNEAHVTVVRAGQVQFTLGETTATLGPGDMAVMFSGVPHSYQALGEEVSRVAEFVILP